MSTTNSTSTSVAAPVAAPVAASVAAPSVAAPVAAPVAASVAVDASGAETKKKRRVVTAETVATSFDEFLALVEAQIEQIRTKAAARPKGASGDTGIRFLRTVGARIKQIKKDAVKVMEASKKRTRNTKGQKTTESGFLKGHPVTPAMASFAGWEPNENKSRIDITNAIISYVKEHNLQDPAARKNILPDQKLKELLNYDPTVPGNEPLTFFYLQKLIAPLQNKAAAAPAAK